MEKSMMRDLIFSSLRFSVLGTPFSGEAKQLAKKIPLSDLFALAKEQKIAHLVGFALKENARLSEEDPISARFEKEMMMAVLTTERIERERLRAGLILEEAGIEHIPLKGAVLRAFYPETWMRTSADADILIPEEKLEQAMGLLQEKRSYRLMERGSHDVSFAAPGGVNIELHFALVEQDRLPEASALLARVWEFAEPVAGKRFEKKLPDELFLFYHLVHMAKHLNNGGVGIRFFVDLYLGYNQMQPNEENYRNLLKEGKMAGFEAVCANLADAVMEGKAESAPAALLEEFVFSGAVFGTWENYVAIRRSRKGKVSYLVDRLFPSYSAMAARYPKLKKHRVLLPFYYAIRIFEHLFSGRLSYSKKEWRENRLVDEKNVDRMATLLEALDLDFHD